MKYQEKLKDVRWQKMRLKIMERDGWKCTMCQNNKETLQVHHKMYVPGRAPWEYKDSNLTTLCASCHEKTHGLTNSAKTLIQVTESKFSTSSVKLCAMSKEAGFSPAAIKLLNEERKFFRESIQ